MSEAARPATRNSAIGGAGQQIERRYGTLTNGVFNGLAATGGSLRQLFGIGGFNPSPGVNCQSGTDANPAPGATIFAGRVTTPTFGLGLVELIPDGDDPGDRRRSAGGDPRHRRHRHTIQLTSGIFTRGQTRVARFGWKAVHASLADFAGDAYLNEMGITTTSCAGGQVVNDFATENRANRAGTNAVINGCPDDLVPGVDDNFAAEENNCAGGLTEVQDDVANFAFFMRNLAPAAARHRQQQRPRPHGVQPRGLQRLPRDHDVQRHARTAADHAFQPFSDFLVHDMGTLGDGIGNDGDSVAVTRRMRTAPLWGLRFRNCCCTTARTSNKRRAPSGPTTARARRRATRSTPPPRRSGTTCCCS